MNHLMGGIVGSGLFCVLGLEVIAHGHEAKETLPTSWVWRPGH